MPRNSTFQKITVKERLIRLQDLLKKYNDEDNELTLKQIIDRGIWLKIPLTLAEGQVFLPFPKAVLKVIVEF